MVLGNRNDDELRHIVKYLARFRIEASSTSGIMAKRRLDRHNCVSDLGTWKRELISMENEDRSQEPSISAGRRVCR